MLHILLLILKIIGIILGVLLGILLLGIVLVLFVPVRYKLEARREQESAMPVELKVKVTWLLHLLNIRLSYSDELRLRVRIFLFTLFRLPKKQKTDTTDGTSNQKRRRRKKADVQNRKDREDREDKSEKKVTVQHEGKETAESVLRTESGNTEESRKAEESGKTVESAETLTEEKTEKKKLYFSIKSLFLKIYRFFQNIWYTITGICDRMKKIWENIEYYLDVLQGETFKKSFSLCKEELASIFAYMKPRRLQADLVIGMGDPAATAKILSYYGILYPAIGDHVTIVPDFDEKRIEGTALVQGKIKFFTLLKAVVRIYFSKDIRRLLKLLKKEDV